jgi:hypothetical protein
MPAPATMPQPAYQPPEVSPIADLIHRHRALCSELWAEHRRKLGGRPVVTSRGLPVRKCGS